jgi:DNA-binding beta-propeller fold protein YncE
MGNRSYPASLAILFVAVAGLTACSSGSGSSQVQTPADFSISVSPGSLSLPAGSSSTFQLTLTPSGGFSGFATVQVSNLPAGITLTPASPFSVAASSSQSVTVSVASTVSAASYTVDFTATSGSLSHSTSANFFVLAPVNPGYSLMVNPTSLILRPGAQGTFQLSMQPSGGFAGDVEVQFSGLPSGVTTNPVGPFALGSSQPAAITVATSGDISDGSYNLQIASSAGTLSQMANEALGIVTGVSPPSRADFVRTDDTPGAAIYDEAHKCVYETNPIAGTVDVISTQTHQILRRIAVPSPAGIDISPDDSTVFIGTETQAIYAVNTANLAITGRYLVPMNQQSAPVVFAQPPQAPVAAPDGTVLLSLSDQIVKWDPATNQFATVLSNAPVGFGYGPAGSPTARSAGHSKVIISNDLSTSTVYVYDTTMNTFSAPLTFNGYASAVAVNPAGTQFAVAWSDNSGEWITFLDANLNTLATVTGGGNLLYSSDGSTLYESGIWFGQLPGIGELSASTYTLTSVKPLYSSNAGNGGGMPIVTVSLPMTTDETGLVFGSANHGLGINDMNDSRNYTSKEVYPDFDLFAVPDNGPVGQISVVEIETTDIPVSAAWFGPAAGGYISDEPYLSLNTGSVSQAGPVNIRMEDQDNVEAWMPQAYTYGSVLANGPDLAGPAAGGVSVPIFGYGLGDNANLPGSGWSANTNITFSGVEGPISTAYSAPSSAPGPYPYPFPLWQLTVNTPVAPQGSGDIVATTSSGSSTLHSAYHALNFQTYAMDGTPDSMIFDSTRQQFYIAVGDHVDVFSLASKSFSSPIEIPALNGMKQVAGLAMTPDGKDLLVSNWADASVAVIDPGSPSAAAAVAIGSVSATSYGQGPNQLAATNTGLVFVGIGPPSDTVNFGGKLNRDASAQSKRLQSANSAPTYTPEAPVWVLSLSSMTASAYAPLISAAVGPSSMAASPDGSQVCIVGEYIGVVLYSSASSSLAHGPLYSGGNACALSDSFLAVTSSNGIAISNFSLLESGVTSLLDYQLGAFGGTPIGVAVDPTGALVYTTYSDIVALFDAHTGEIRETIAVPAPLSELLYDNGTIAVDNTGSQIFVFTASGLTEIQIDALPLAIGSITVSGSSWNIVGTGFSSSTVVSIDGNPVTPRFNGTNELQLSNAPSLSGSHTIALINPDGHSYTYDVAYFMGS